METGASAMRIYFTPWIRWVTRAVATFSLAICVMQSVFATPSRDGWVAGWAAAPTDAFLSVPLQNQTIRQLVTLHQGGQAVRLRLSNRFGAAPVKLNEVWVGVSEHNAAIRKGSSRQLMFAGKPAVTLAPGANVLSDPVELEVMPMQRLAISLYSSGHISSMSRHFRSNEYLWRAIGNQSPKEDGKGFARILNPLMHSWWLIEGVEVLTPEPPRVLVAFGDSITDGFVSILGQESIGQDARYPDYLAQRFIASGMPVSVVNTGVSGNQLLSPASALRPTGGPSGLSRLRQDVVEVPGVTDVLVLIGINDLGWSLTPHAGDVIEGLKTVVEALHAVGLRVVLGTLTPSKGALAGLLHGRASVDIARQQINQWILTSGVADGVVDFDACLRDPAAPSHLLAEYDSGDHLHPNPRGYQAMSECVDLSLF